MPLARAWFPPVDHQLRNLSSSTIGDVDVSCALKRMPPLLVVGWLANWQRGKRPGGRVDYRVGRQVTWLIQRLVVRWKTFVISGPYRMCGRDAPLHCTAIWLWWSNQILDIVDYCCCVADKPSFLWISSEKHSLCQAKSIYHSSTKDSYLRSLTKFISLVWSGLMWASSCISKPRCAAIRSLPPLLLRIPLRKVNA